MAHQGFAEPQLQPEFSQHSPQSVVQQQDSALMQQESAPVQEVVHLMQSLESLQKKSTGLEMQLSEARDMAYAAASRSTAADQNARKLAQVALASMSQAKRSIDHEQKLAIQAKKSVDHEKEMESEQRDLLKVQQELQAELSLSKAAVVSLKMVQTDMQGKTAKAQKENMEMSARLSQAKESLNDWQQDLSKARMNGGEGIRERQEVAAQMEHTMRPLETEASSFGEQDAAYSRLTQPFDDPQEALPGSFSQASESQEASSAIRRSDFETDPLQRAPDSFVQANFEPRVYRQVPEASLEPKVYRQAGTTAEVSAAQREVPALKEHQHLDLLGHLRSRSADLARRMMDPWSSDGQ